MVLDYANVLATSSPTGAETPMQSVHRHRLLRDVAEMQRKPYPRIRLTPVDHTQACLVLTPEGYPPLHLTVLFGPQYPLQPPRITIQSKIRHPNVFGNFICASILNTAEGYTPAYTLRGICIQMLSFFHSDGVEQADGGGRVSLSEYKKHGNREHERVCSVCREARAASAAYTCTHCDFGCEDKIAESNDGSSSSSSSAERNEESNDGHKLPPIQLESSANGTQKRAVLEASVSSLPDEILLETLENVDFEDLVAFAQAWPRVRQLLRDYDLIRSRELQCFTTKHGYKQASLGVGIALTPTGLVPRIDSEFNLISWEAYEKLRVRVSVHGIPYQYWLPLPISRRHWLRVRDKAGMTPRLLARHVAKPSRGGGPQVSAVAALFCFMNDVVVRLSLDLERQQGPSGRRPRRRPSSLSDEDEDDEGSWCEKKSTLRHASEKAIGSYFHLFHLLVCLATGPGGKDIVAEASTMIRSFLRGRRSKRDVPNLGHPLTAMHISDIPVTDELRKAIITEAITRNVVWLLDGRGAGLAELAYLEDDAVSHYRLKKTFGGGASFFRHIISDDEFPRINTAAFIFIAAVEQTTLSKKPSSLALKMPTTMDPEDYTVVPIPFLNATVSNVELMARVSVIFDAPLSFEKLHAAWITALQARPIMQAQMKKCDSAPSGLAYHVLTPTGMAKYLEKQNHVPDHLRDFYCLDESHRSIRNYCPGFGTSLKEPSKAHGGILISQGPELLDQKRCTAFNAVENFHEMLHWGRPQTTIQVTRFSDATMITLSVNHAFGDLVTIKSFLKAWESALYGNHVQPYERPDADPFIGYEPGGEFAAQNAPDKSPAPPPGWQVYGILDKARFMKRHLWDYYVKRPESTIEDRRIFIPNDFVEALEDRARYDLTLLQKKLDKQSGGDKAEDNNTTTAEKKKKKKKKLYVSRSDVLYAWLLKHSHAHLPPEQPSTAVTISNGRFRPPAGPEMDPKSLAENDLLCAAMPIALPSLSAGKVMTLPLGELALHIRNGIKANTSPENIKKWLNFQFHHGLWKSPSGELAVPFQPNHFMTGVTDWRAVRLGQVDFTPARLHGNTATAVSVCAIDGHMVVSSSRRDLYICLGDVDGGVLILGYASKDQWQDPRSFGKYNTVLREPKSKL